MAARQSNQPSKTARSRPAKATVPTLENRIRHRHHAVRRWIIVPACYLLLVPIEEITILYLGDVSDPHLRTLAIIALLAAGISLIAFVVVPVVEKLLKGIYLKTKRGIGLIGEVAFIGALFAGIYWLFYTLYAGGGPQALLPAGLVIN